MSLAAAWDNYAQRADDALATSDSQAQVESSLWSAMGLSEQQDNSVFGGLSRKQRIVGFLLFVVAALLCFALEVLMLLIPGAVALKPRKFVLLHSLGILCAVLSFSMLLGPWKHFQQLTARERLPFTLAFFSALLATIYCALQGQTLLTLLCAILQAVAVAWYIIKSVPGGSTGLVVMFKICARSSLAAGKTLLPL